MNRLSRICTLWLPIVACAGCGGGVEVATVDPDVRRTVEAFWQSFGEPYLHAEATGPPNLKNAYDQLHQDARQRQTLEEFNQQWTQWVQMHSIGWVSGAEIVSSETTTSGLTRVVVRVKFERADPITPTPAQEGPRLRMTLHKEGSAWTISTIEEETDSE